MLSILCGTNSTIRVMEDMDIMLTTKISDISTTIGQCMEAMVLITSGKTINHTTDSITTTTRVIKNLLTIITAHGHLIKNSMLLTILKNSSIMRHHISVTTTDLSSLTQHLTTEISIMLLHSITKQLTTQKLSILITLLIQHHLTLVISMLTSKEISIMPLHSTMKLLTIQNSILLLITNSSTKISIMLHQYTMKLLISQSSTMPLQFITHQQLISCIMTSMPLCLIWKPLIITLLISITLITSLLLSQIIMSYSTLLQSSTTSTTLLLMLHHITKNNLPLLSNTQISLIHLLLATSTLVTLTTSVPTQLQQTTMLTSILRPQHQSTLQLQTTGTANLTMDYSTTTVSITTTSQ